MRKLRTAGASEIASLEHALVHLKLARTHVVAGGAPKTHAKIHSAVKSLQGAINHASRAHAKARTRAAVGSQWGAAMSTLKALKASFKPGIQIHVIDHWMERYRNTVRTVTKVQGNGYWFTQAGDPKRHWGDYPKASQLQFDGSIAKVVIDERRYWTLRLPTGEVQP